MIKNMIFIIVPLFICAFAYAGVSTSPNSDGYYEIDGSIDVDTTLTSDKQYLLYGIVYVEGYATLTIEAGTIIRGVLGNFTGDGYDRAPGTLVITRTGKINAVGTAADPIIFTFRDDPYPAQNPTIPITQDSNFHPSIQGLWGGIIVLGNAPTNNNESSLDPGIGFIEGLPSYDQRGVYGGHEPHDSSGTLKYVSIRRAGADDGFAIYGGPYPQGKGLTLAGVGDGTVIEYIEAFACADDGFAIYGGTVCLKYCLSSYNEDDAFDYNEGWNGQGQFWAVVQANDYGDEGGEFDGVSGGDQAGALPYSVPAIYNMTVIGGGGGRIQFRREAGGYLHNSIFVDSGNDQLEIESTSANMQEAGLLRIGNNIWCADSSLQDGGTAVFDGIAPWGANNVSANPFLGGMNYYMNLTIKQRNEVDGVPLIPDATAEVVLNLAPYYGHFLDPVKFKGAFDPATEAWTKGWTVGSALGYFIEYPSVGTNFADTDSDGLNDYQEVAYGADPNLADTSGDGLNDGVVVNAGFDPTVNYSNLANPFRDGMIDLRPGSTMITVENGEAILSMELEKSDDLEIWTSGGTTDLQIPLDNDTDTKFFRFKMAD